MVFHEHGSAVRIESGSALERFAYKWFQTLAAPRVDAHIAISLFVARSLAEIAHGRVRNPIVLYNPTRNIPAALELTDRAMAKQSLGVPAGAFVVGMVARIIRRKGWRDFLAAVSLLAKNYPLFFLIAGDGPEYWEMKSEIAAAGLEQNGRALGYVDNTESIYRALDCFVMPSHWEAAGLSHIEAQSFSIPVVACNVSGLNETVRENVNCLLCCPNDPEDMAEKIALLMTDHDLRNRIAQAGRLNAESYSIERYAAQLDALYRQLTGSR